MQQVMEVKDYIKPPFANYDLVVYLGCGLFFLPLIFHYIVEPLGIQFPQFEFQVGVPFADSAIATLSLFFSVYILGHMIAYVASHAIEKTVDLFFGKISTALIISHNCPSGKFAETVQAWIVKKFSLAFKRPHRISSTLRGLFLFPVWPTLIFIVSFRQLEYFKSRVPPRVFIQVKAECARRGFGQIGLHTKWFKAIEHDVINNDPLALGRMYNYLLIGGVFRSLCFIFLCCSWAEFYFWMHKIFHGDELVKSLSQDPLRYGHAITFMIMNVLFGFSLSAYLKFARRYVEEAVFSFVLSK